MDDAALDGLFHGVSRVAYFSRSKDSPLVRAALSWVRSNQ